MLSVSVTIHFHLEKMQWKWLVTAEAIGPLPNASDFLFKSLQQRESELKKDKDMHPVHWTVSACVCMGSPFSSKSKELCTVIGKA